MTTQDLSNDESDKVLASLGEIAYGVEPTQKELPSGRRSRFFYKPTTSFKAQVEETKVKFAPKKLDHIDSESEARLVTYREELPEALKTNLESVREFFLTQVSPLTLATNAGSIQAKEVAQKLLGTDIDNTIFERFERMVNTAANLRMAAFVTSYMGLPKSATKHIVMSIASAKVKDSNSEMSDLIRALEKYSLGANSGKNKP